MPTFEVNVRSRLKALAVALREQHDIEMVGCFCAAGLVAGFLVLTGLPETRFVRDLLLFLLALLVCRIAALLMGPA